jgi:hypothetical protein
LLFFRVDFRTTCNIIESDDGTLKRLDVNRINRINRINDDEVMY